MRFNPLVGKGLDAVSFCTAFINILEGAVRSSKTISTLVWFIRYCVHGPVGELIIVGKTERTVERNIIAPLRLMLGPKRLHYNRGTGVLRMLGRTIYVVGANNEAARTKIQGLTLAGAYVDEVGVIPESFFNMLVSRLSVDGAQLLATANPEGKNHWLKKNWLDKATQWMQADGTIVTQDTVLDYSLHRVTFVLDDNVHISLGFRNRLKASYTGVWYRRFILSEWTNAEGAVYDMFDEAHHVVPWESLPPMKRLLAFGSDYGTTNASAAGLLGWGFDDRLYIIDEWRLEKKQGEAAYTDAQISESFRNWMIRDDHLPYKTDLIAEWVFVDPAAASFKTQLFYDGIGNVANADNDVVAGIKLVATLLQLGRLKISSKCPELIKEIPGYVWDTKAAENGLDKPVKKDDHSLDGALRYPVYSTRHYWAEIMLGEMKELAGTL